MSRLPPDKKKITVTVYAEREQLDALERIREATRVPTAERIREGIDMVLKKHAAELAKADEESAPTLTLEVG